MSSQDKTVAFIGKLLRWLLLHLVTLPKRGGHYHADNEIQASASWVIRWRSTCARNSTRPTLF